MDVCETGAGAGAGTGVEMGCAVTTTCGACCCCCCCCCEELTTGLGWVWGLDGCCCWTTGWVVGFLDCVCCCCGGCCCCCCSACKLEGNLNEGGVVWRIGDSVADLKGIWCLKSELMSKNKY